MLKQIGGAVAAVCISLGGCMQIQTDLTSVQHATLSATQDHVDAEVPEEQDSEFQEYAPWRTSERRPSGVSDLSHQAGSQPVK